MSDRSYDPAGPTRQAESFRAGLDDLVIVPLVAVAFVVWRVVRRIFFILVDIIDFLFPILLQVMRFPLFTLRIIGDGLAALLKLIVRILPVGGDRRAGGGAARARRTTMPQARKIRGKARSMPASRIRARR